MSSYQNIRMNTLPISIFLLHFLLSNGSSEKKDFLIDTSSCKMPNLEVFSSEANKTYYSLPPIQCWHDLLTHVTIDNNIAHLRFRKEYLSKYYQSEEEIDCCYRYVTRNGTPQEPDVGYSTTPCYFFNSTITLHEDTVLVNCFKGPNKIYENVHRTILVTPSIQKKIKMSFKKQWESKRTALSVILLVVDSLSRLNFHRTMPLTRDFVLENDFIEFLAYNKIDENTFPNFNALLTGLSLKQSKALCKPNLVGHLDKCPMIWYDYREQGYVTAYAEDWASISTFNYLKKGFKNPPADYYFKTYMEATEGLLGSFSVDSMPFCAGPESQGDRILNLAKDFMKTFKGHPHFGIFWMNTFSHNYVNTPSRMDQKMKDILENIKQDGVLNGSMVILLSDHGMRFGDSRRTIQGWYEDKLPMNFISLPPWFQKAHPEKYLNLKKNAAKLTSTYDLYATLQEVLKLSMEDYVPTPIKGCPRCESLFSNISATRSCEDAGIPEEWCTCLGNFDTNDVDIEDDLNERAFEFLKMSGRLEPSFTFDRSLVSGISRASNARSYFLMVFQAIAEDAVVTYEGLFEIATQSLDFIRVLSLHTLY